MNLPLTRRTTSWHLTCVLLGAATGLLPLSGLADEVPPSAVSTQAASVANTDPVVVRIGHIGPVTGPIAHLGRDNENGARLAIEELNRRGVVIGGQKVQLELWASDDAGNPRVGLGAAEALLEKGVVGVIGHLNSGTSIPASVVYNRAGIPHISPSATNPKLTRNGYKTTFRVIMDDEDLGKSLGQYAVGEMAAKRIVVVDDRTAYGQGLADYFAGAVKARGGTVLARDFTTDKATDFTALVGRLKPLAPDMVFYGGMDATAGPLIKELHAQEVSNAFMGGDGICSSELPKLAGSAAMARIRVVCAEGGGIQNNRKADMDDFYRRYKARFNTDVKVYAPYTYDAVQVLVKAMEMAGSFEPKIYLPVLAKTSAYLGITGEISFDDKGDILHGAYTLYHYPGMIRSGLEVRLGE